ncbi:hypothetical protein TanjilG_10502 [Lupinus angustifolius]|uniref:Uncharacterized protein n=1 Tax=Lupinus angustifolius TaxID=3871 RepID=A0A1J7GRN1_LUPAN|nr:hypothetical protein TanjilG_10502 [Lupinus angustifolius]
MAIVDSQVARENIPSMRRQYFSNHINPQRELISNPIVPNFNRPVLMQKPRNFTNSRVFQAPFSEVASRGSSSSFLFNNRGSTSQLSQAQRFSSEAIRIQQEMRMKMSPIDGTMPLINMLDKPINNNDFIIGDNNLYRGNPDLRILDLTLKL